MPEQELIGKVFGWFVSQIAGAIMGAIGGAIMPGVWRHVQRRRVAAKVSEAYYNFQAVCEPQILDPENPGNTEYMKARARDSANILTRRLEAVGFFPPPRCTTEPESLHEWYRFLENARMVIG